MQIEPVILQGKHVRLEPLAESHAADLLVAAQSEDIWRYMPTHPPKTLEDMQVIISNALKLRATGTQMPFAIIDQASQKAIGSSRYLDIQPLNKGIEIGWTWLGQDYWRSVRNTECKYLLLSYAFEQQGAIRVQLKTDRRNQRSQLAIERIGAVKEGILRQHMIMPDGYLRDSVYYSILDGEWPGVKKRLEAILNKE